MKEGRRDAISTNSTKLESTHSFYSSPSGLLQPELDISKTSFKRWHRRLQNEHILLGRQTFTLWKCCNKACKPCRWFDSIDYDKKICKCCLKFRTFKTLGTLVLLGTFVYILTYSIYNEDVLPGGTVFFLFVLFITAYLTGYALMLIGLPPMLGHLLIGIIFEQIPNLVLNRDNETVEEFAKISKKMLLVVALIRAGLLLDMSRIQHQVMFILRLSLLPFCCEFLIVWVSAHFILKLPWDWSAVQGSVIGVVSLASVTSVMEKNKENGYGEDKDLSTVLLASSVMNVAFGVCLYAVCISYVIPQCGQIQSYWKLLLLIIEELCFGFSVGGVAGLLVSFFPDKRNTEAAALRILLLGVGGFAIANVFYESHMSAAAVLGCLTMCIIATNMWEELGWHKDSNPVQYFYTKAYYVSQPAVLSLLGYTINFKDSDKTDIGLSVSVVLLGLIVREFVCFSILSGKTYPTTLKEKIFICIAWLSKGTFQALLADAVQFTVKSLSSSLLGNDEKTTEEYLKYVRKIRETTIMSILLTTPFVCFTLTLLSPILLTKIEPSVDVSSSDKINNTKKHPGSTISHD